MRHLSTPGTCDAAELKAAPARAELAEKQARYDQARRVIQSGPPGVLIDSERLAHLRARRADMLRRHAELESSYGALDPAVHDAHAELSDLEALMAAESARELMRLRNEAGLARARLATLHQKIAECPRPGVDRPFRLRELPGGGSDHQHDLYKLLQRIRPPAREREPSMASAATAPESPNPPKFGRAFLLSIGLGLASALAAGLLTELSWDSPR
jgi:uncharacterized protein involved in exopolysaccharide biosynthesis